MLTFIEGVFKPYFSSASGTYVEPTPGAKVRLAKVFGAQGQSIDPEMPKFYNVLESVNPTGLEQVKRLLDEYCKDPTVALLRASPVNGIRNVRRTAENFNCSVKSRIIHMDIDGIKPPEDAEVASIEQQAKYCISLLNSIDPEKFPLDAAFVAKASGSAGIKQGIRIHMYLLSNIAVSNGQIKWLAYQINRKSKETLEMELLDTSVYDKVHLMYTADPVFEKPNMNPFLNKERVVYSDGTTLTLPEMMPEYNGLENRVKVGRKDFHYITDIDGLRELPSFQMREQFEKLENATDNVFMKRSIAVYAAAIEHGVDINWLDEKVREVLNAYVVKHGSKRSVEEYINNAKQAALSNILSRSLRTIEGSVDVSVDAAEPKLLPIKEAKTDSDAKDRFLHINKLPPEDTLTFVKASLGTGKTTTVQTWLSSGLFEGRFIAVTNTVSLVEGNAKKLGAGVYNRLKDYNDFKTGWREGFGEYDTRYDRMSTTIHSLHRFRDTIEQRGLDFLFIDECDAVMNDILFSECVKERSKCIATLSLAMQNAKYVILSDGDVSPETIEAYSRLCDPVKPIIAYKHDRKMLAGVEARELFDEQSIWAAMQGSLEIGEKCILVSDCSPDELNEKGIALREATGCNLKEIHKNSTKDADIREILTYGNASLQQQNVDGLLCSPSVTSGVDFSYFDSVFLLTRDSAIHTPNLRFQALRRDRGAQYIYYYTSYATEGMRTGWNSYDQRLGWLDLCRKKFAHRRQQECQKYQSTFRMLLRDQGCHIILDPSKWGRVETRNDIYLEERINAILSATPVYQMVRHNDAWEVKTYITRYYDEVDDMGDVDVEVVKKWLKQKPHDRAAFFHKIQREFWGAIKSCKYNWDPFVRALEKNPAVWYQCTGMDVRTEKWRIKRYLAAAGVKEPGQYDHLIKWYRTYCRLEGIQIPFDFLTPEEKEMHEQKVSELGVC